MEYIAVAGFVYLIFGAFIAALTSGRSLVDLILDTVLWPVIVYYWLTRKHRLF